MANKKINSDRKNRYALFASGYFHRWASLRRSACLSAYLE